MRNDGLLLIDKPAGVTSFQLLSPIKKHYNTKVGHGGTLDKFATGLMIVLVGRWTRLADLFSGLDKRYYGVICFGEETSTLDPEGEIIRTADIPTQELFEQAVSEMHGPIDQIPPVYSAIHLNGKRAWQRARSGEQVEMKARPITVYQMSVEGWNPPYGDIRVHCSKGTYVRSIARDLGIATDSAARLQELRREQIGSFLVEQAITVDQLEGVTPMQGSHLFEGIPNLDILKVSEDDARLLRMGKPLCFPWLEGCDNTRIIAFTKEDELVASLVCESGRWRYHFVAG